MLGGSSAGALRLVAAAYKAGFETPIRVPQRYSTYKLQALSAAGKVIGTSAAFG